MIDASNLEDVARAALVAAYECSEQRRECGGLIYELDGKYYYALPETQDKPFTVELHGYLAKPIPPARVVADYHNHPCMTRNKEFAAFFSAGDVLVNDTFHTVGYLLDGCTGVVHRFDPSQDDRDDEEVHMTSGRVFFLTIGHVSGWIDIFK
jgi:hypothetical protein